MKKHINEKTIIIDGHKSPQNEIKPVLRIDHVTVIMACWLQLEKIEDILD